eukprot:TRINITY_DN70198_c0_g1_i1.p1 TRINITY_DN70198_c0_g1~~TRINITY_DN70198_c0_g1_i1.p1  ORF type:complete len:443 (+),score=62.86 TRINITY_DN70198_c0_g1_i1:119-1447(+)
MKRPAAAKAAGARPPKRAKPTLKRPAGCKKPVKKPAAAAAALKDITLPALAPVYHPSERPKPDDIKLGFKEPPRARSQVVKSASFNQSSLRSLAAQTPHILKLHLCGSGISNPAVLDFSARGVFFPEMTHLEVQNWPLRSGVFTERVFPKLKALHIIFPFDSEPNTPDDWDRFEIQLPDLRSLILECPGTVEPSELRASTLACPSLVYLCLYKVSVETLSLVLPSARQVWLHRLDCLKSLTLYAPCVKEVRLQACYDLTGVKVLQRAQGAPRVEIADSKFVLDVTNCCFIKTEIERLREIPRVKYVVLPNDEDSASEDEEAEAQDASVVFRLGHLMKPPGFSTMQLDGLCSMRPFGDEIGVCVLEKVQAAKKVEVKQVARLLEWGAQALYAWYDVVVSDEARALAKQAKVPLRLWAEVTCRGRHPILGWAGDMKKQIRKACG